jgi:hypothetical protein
MNKNTLSQTVVVCEKPIEGTVNMPPFRNPPVRSTKIVERQLIWSSRKPNDWEILVYKQTEDWEACFFRWPIHHEHVMGSSFELVRQKAERRIRLLEAGRLKSAEWPHRSVTTTSQDPVGPQAQSHEPVRCEPQPVLRTSFLRRPNEFGNRR